MTQFQISRTDPARTRLAPVEDEEYAARLEDGAALVRVDRFGLSANNVTYVVLGDRLGYWRFFPAEGADGADWGVMPVWGFGDVVASRAPGLEAGERLFGYFPTATHLMIRPQGGPGRPVLDASAHRSELPRAYNSYQRVRDEPGYDPADDDLRMLLFPLHITSWALWEALRGEGWYGAEQVVVVSASSKTALGLAHALRHDQAAPSVLGVTSERNRAFVTDLGLYDSVVGYEDPDAAVPPRPSVIVDLAGSGPVLGRLHRHLGELMLRSLNVGLTHWDEAGRTPDLITERSEMFFAPAVIQARMQEWGGAEFARRSQHFLAQTLEASRDWLRIERSDGLESLAARYAEVRSGATAPDQGLVVAP